MRAEYTFINESYRAYILKSYEHTYYPEQMLNAGKASYVERNREMIDKSQVCVVYYNPDYVPPRRMTNNQPKSGTKTAFEHAVKKGKHILNVYKKV